MNISVALIVVRLALSVCLFIAFASREAGAQLSGLYQSVPETFATYQYHADGIQSVALPVDLTLSFSHDESTSMLAATIFKPIIGAPADGTPNYPIVGFFPMRITGTSQNGQEFHGDLLGTQYLFDWHIAPAGEGELLLNGHVYWAGGRIEVTTINNARLVPAVAGDYNRDGIVDGADYVVWRINKGTTNPLPNDPIGGTIGEAHYNQWRAHFGETAASGASLAGTAVPEPATILILLTGMLAMLNCPRQTCRRNAS